MTFKIDRFKPTGDRVLLSVLPRETTSPGGIILVDGRTGREQRARVVAVGPGRWRKGAAERLPMRAKVGDTVIFDPYKVLAAFGPMGARSAGTEYAGAGDHAVVGDDAILAVEGATRAAGWYVDYRSMGAAHHAGPYDSERTALDHARDIGGFESVLDVVISKV